MARDFQQEVIELSTEGLVAAATILQQTIRQACDEGYPALAAELRARLAAVDREISRRQRTIFDELDFLRRQNASERNDLTPS